jgi:hypothetical protein
MRSRAPENVGVVRTIALGLLLVFASGSPAPVAVAQGGPPPLTPFRGLIDHVSAAPSGWPPSGSVESGSHAISGDGRYVVME